jgi:hypothetical protein
MSHPPSLPHLTYDIARKLDAEIGSARAKYPNNKHTLAALMEETGELAQALLQAQPREDIRKEALQVAATALRIYMEGDHYIDTDHVLSTDEIAEEEETNRLCDLILRDLWPSSGTGIANFTTSPSDEYVKKQEAKYKYPFFIDFDKFCNEEPVDPYADIAKRLFQKEDKLDALRYAMRENAVQSAARSAVLSLGYGMSPLRVDAAYQLALAEAFNHAYRVFDFIKINNEVHQITSTVTQLMDETIIEVGVVFSPKRPAEFIDVNFILGIDFAKVEERAYGETIFDYKTYRDMQIANDFQTALYLETLRPYNALDVEISRQLQELAQELEEREAERIDNEFEELWKQRVTTLQFLGTLVDITISIPVANLSRSYTLQSVAYNVIATDELISRKIDEIRTELYETYVEQET